jgi:hypothetical protein
MLGLLSPPTSARIRSRIAENAAVFTFLLPGDGNSISEHVAGLFFLWEELHTWPTVSTYPGATS